MKLSSTISILSSVATAASDGKIKTLIDIPDSDRKVPDRHPLQRLWRLYQFSEEIIQEHLYSAPGFINKPQKLDKLRNRIGKWQYLAQRQSYLIGKY